MNRMFGPAAAGIAALGIVFGACSDRVAEPTPATTAESAATSAPATQPASSQATAAATTTVAVKGGLLSTEELVKLAEPAIVRIRSAGGTGTGFVVSADGDIITNNHVVAGSRTVSVTLSDGSIVSGRVTGADPRADLALVKIDGVANLKPLKVGKLADVVVGQDVVAIGYALDLKGGEGPSFSVTRGIVSAKNRAISEGSAIAGAIQTDAPINHGNSGGPLLNMRGEVVGVNTALAADPTSSTGTATGIGFAVGADVVQAVYDELRATGSVNRGFLGISNFEALRPARAKELGLPAETTGVYLGNADSVVAGNPAASAGLRTGDVITKISGVSIKTESDLSLQMIREEPGKTVDIEFYRDGQKQTARVTLGTAPVQ